MAAAQQRLVAEAAARSLLRRCSAPNCCQGDALLHPALTLQKRCSLLECLSAALARPHLLDDACEAQACLRHPNHSPPGGCSALQQLR